MNLRPHHLLCIQKFTGHGYSESFTEHMTSIVKELRSEPEPQITVTKGCDELCKMCPNNTDNACTTLQKVDFMDSSVLSICDLTYGETVLWKYAANKARERIFETDEFSKICSSCEWFELCKNTEITQ